MLGTAKSDSLVKPKQVKPKIYLDAIAKLDEAGKTFKMLVIKTPHTKPEH